MAQVDQAGHDGGGDASLTLGDLLVVVRHRWRLIAGVTLALTALALGVAVVLPAQYEAVATVQIDPRKRTILNLENVISDLRADNATVESEVEVLRSKTLALKVIEGLGLRDDPEFTRQSQGQKFLRLLGFGEHRAASQAPRGTQAEPALGLGTAPAENDPQRDIIASAFEQRLRAQRVRNSLLIEVRFKASDPVLAAKIANALLEAYLREQLVGKSKATEEASGLLEQKLEGLRLKVFDAEHKIALFKAQNNIFDSEGQLLSEKQLARMMEQSVAARNNTAETKARYQQIRVMLDHGRSRTAVAEMMQNPSIRTLKEQLSRATRREAELLSRYGPKHPEMVKARAEVAEAQLQLFAEVDPMVAGLKTEYQIAEERERTLAANLKGLTDQQVVSKGASVRLRELEREAQSSRQVFETVLNRYKQTAETQDLQVADGRIIEKAGVPLSVSSPKRLQITVAGLLAGLALGFGLAFSMEFSSPGVSRAEDVEMGLQIPHLASLPLLGKADGIHNAMQALNTVLSNPRGSFAEGVRSVRHGIDLPHGRDGARVILIVSSLPHEGKTLVAANLAQQMAATGSPTLLIDADIRRGTLSQHLGIVGQEGLRHAFAKGEPFEDYILRDMTSGLAVLPAGDGRGLTLSSAEAISAPDFGQRLERLRGYFDTIIIDAPPLLPVVDARMLADHADHIVMVVAWRRTPQQLARRAIGLLGSNMAKLAGVIVNGVDPREHAVSIGNGTERSRPGGERWAA